MKEVTSAETASSERTTSEGMGAKVACDPGANRTGNRYPADKPGSAACCSCSGQ